MLALNILPPLSSFAPPWTLRDRHWSDSSSSITSPPSKPAAVDISRLLDRRGSPSTPTTDGSPALALLADAHSSLTEASDSVSRCASPPSGSGHVEGLNSRFQTTFSHTNVADGQSYPPSSRHQHDPQSIPPLSSLRGSEVAPVSPEAASQKRPAALNPHPQEPPAKKQSKWSAEENARIVELRGSNMKWEDIAKRIPGRSAISCRLHYQNFLERKAEWDHEKDNKLARLYDRFKREMWERISNELAMPWRAVEARHWELGPEELAQRAGVPRFSSSYHPAPSEMPPAGAPTNVGAFQTPYSYAALAALRAEEEASYQSYSSNGPSLERGGSGVGPLPTTLSVGPSYTQPNTYSNSSTHFNAYSTSSSTNLPNRDGQYPAPLSTLPLHRRPIESTTSPYRHSLTMAGGNSLSPPSSTRTPTATSNIPVLGYGTITNTVQPPPLLAGIRSPETSSSHAPRQTTFSHSARLPPMRTTERDDPDSGGGQGWTAVNSRPPPSQRTRTQQERESSEEQNQRSDWGPTDIGRRPKKRGEKYQ